MTLNRPRLIAAILAIAVVLCGFYWFAERRDSDATLTLYGNVDIRDVSLGFRVPGRLAEMLVDEGDTVQAGQVIARLDAEPYRESLAAAAAQVGRAQANLDKLETGTRPQELEQARAQVQQTEAAHANAKRELDRQRGLVATGASSARAFEAAQERSDTTAAALAAARAGLDLANAGFRTEDVAAARAELAVARAALEQAQTQLDDTTLAAPSAAVVMTRVREPGTVLAQGAPVYSLSLEDPVYVRAYVGEADLGRVAPGDRVVITTDSSTQRFAGQIGFISPRAEFTPRSVETTELRTDLVYRLRIVVTGQAAGLRHGMPVTVAIARHDGDAG
jgi:HlyD family secretion protein